MSSIRVFPNGKFVTETKVEGKKAGFSPVIKTPQVSKRAVISTNFRISTIKRK